MSRPVAPSPTSTSNPALSVPGTKPVASEHALPLSTLLPYLRSSLPGFSLRESSAPLSIAQFTHGQSNPTYLLQVGDASSRRRYVLRKQPNGTLLPSAHAVDREYAILTALRNTKVPVPRTFCLCKDKNVIGTLFYIMEYVEGRMFKDVELKGMNSLDRFAIYSAMNRVLANLHSIPLDQLKGVEGFSGVSSILDAAAKGGAAAKNSSSNYAVRQLKRWSQQYESSKTDSIPEVDDLRQWLQQNVPTDEDSNRLSIVHGDFRLDNLIFHPKEARVIAVLDWELCSIGHPTADLAYNCMVYHVPRGIKSLPGLRGLPLAQLGIPTESAYIAAYVRNSRREGDVLHYPFYVGLSIFRMVSIASGVYKRSLQGNASSSEASVYGELTKKIAKLGLEIVQKASRGESITEKGLEQSIEQKIEQSLLPFTFSPQFHALRHTLLQFMDTHIYPNESTYFSQHASLKAKHGNGWHIPPIVEELKLAAKERGLWNLFLTISKQHPHSFGAGLTVLEYAPLCEILGRSPLMAPEACNCAAPDTGNMEVLTLYGSPEQQDKWLKPLLNGDIRSCFGMTEPAVASSDATNIECLIERDGDDYIVNGRKWWTSGAMDPRCRLCVLMGKTDKTKPLHQQQSMILVDMKSPGVKIVRHLEVFGFDDSPHGHAEVLFDNVRVPASNLLLGEGRGFEIAQGRLGPGRIHHVMRLIGMAERALELMVNRVLTRNSFGQMIAKKGTILKDIADSRIEIDQCRLLTLQASSMMDTIGNKHAKSQIAAIKVAAPNMALRVIDRSIQAHGAAGVCQDTILPFLWSHARTLRIADGPDEVHRETIAKMELRRAKL